ncbi:MAG: gp436 family protein [Methylobacter sp.]
MAYCTEQNLIDRYGETELIQLTDQANAAVIDTGVLNSAIADADAEINSYLTAYALPLATIPANFERMACDITRYYLFGSSVPELVQKRYDNAISYLKLVAKGGINIAPDTSGTVAAPSSDDVAFQSSPSVFGRNF